MERTVRPETSTHYTGDVTIVKLDAKATKQGHIQRRIEPNAKAEEEKKNRQTTFWG